MSVINKMLQELDQRQAAPAPGGSALRPMRRGVAAGRKGREAFWRLLALLMLAGIVGVAVLMFQLQTQPVVTNLALKAAEDARTRSVQIAAPQPVVAPLVPIAGPVQAVPETLPVPAAPGPASGSLKLAPSIRTPIPPEREGKPSEPRTATMARAKPPAPIGATGASRSPETTTPRSETPANSAKLEKLDRPRTPHDQAEAEFRRAVALLNEGRIADAQDSLAAALRADRTHEAARQALVALLLEQRKIEPARAVLQEGLAVNPGNPVFASSLARILIESKEYDSALRTLQGASTAGASRADFQALVGAVHQRLGRHKEAMEAYQAALRLSSASGSSWIGLGISLEALGHRPEAAEAFRRAIATGSLSGDLRRFADTRLRETQ